MYVYTTDSVKAGNASVKDSQINHQIGCWFRMKFTSNKNEADITPNSETTSRETASTSAETDTDRFCPVDNTVVGPNSESEG